MALDGAFLRHIKKELEDRLLGARVDKVHQPNREELVISFKSFGRYASRSWSVFCTSTSTA